MSLIPADEGSTFLMEGTPYIPRTTSPITKPGETHQNKATIKIIDFMTVPFREILGTQY